jgi:two-component sensor histidine kinase
MTGSKQAPISTIALRRIDLLTGRVFTLGALLTGGETVVHAYNQSEYLNPLWLWPALAFLVGALVYNFVNFWFLKANGIGYLIHGVAYAFAYLTWWQQAGAEFPTDDSITPWLWSAAGTASIAFGMFIPKIWAVGFMASVPIGWCVLHASTHGGQEDLPSLISDALYVSFFPGTLVVLVWLLRQAAIRADFSSDVALATELEQVTKETQIREQVRLDSILYTSVFDALKAAAKAKSAADYDRVVELSKDSLTKIALAENPGIEELSTMALFETLERLVARIDPDCSMSIRGSSLTFIPKDVASALSDAAVQALNNSIQHAGAKATRSIHLKSGKRGVKLVISDDGLGFRPSRVPDQSLGFRFVIIKRVESVGGKVRIDSSPSNGTQIILEWEVEA